MNVVGQNTDPIFKFKETAPFDFKVLPLKNVTAISWGTKSFSVC